MDKVKFYCSECEHIFYHEYKEIADLHIVKCPTCKSLDIFCREFIYDKEPDRTPLKLGNNGCGTPGRFK